jgi:type IX secretion system PorP/SprF family membrane protein
VPLLFVLACLTATPALAQVHPFTDQYLLNLYQLNPAVAGTERYAPLTFNTRQQWIGFGGAPSTQSVTYHTRLRAKGMYYTNRGFRNKGKNSFGKIGLGGGFFNYSYGSVSQTGIHFDYAYHISLDRGRLALGLAPSLYQYRLNKLGGLTFADPNEPLLSDSTYTGSLFYIDFNAGAHYYSDEFYAGVSLIQLVGSQVKFGDFVFPDEENPFRNPDLSRSVYAYAGYYFDINRDIRIEPMVLLKYHPDKKFRFDLNATFHYRDVFMAGAGYRWKESFTAFAGVRLDNFAVRYLFEIPTIKNLYRFTSHTIQITFNLGQPIE